MKFDLHEVTAAANALADSADYLHNGAQVFSTAKWSGNVFGTFPESATFLNSIVSHQDKVLADIRAVASQLQESSQKIHADAQKIVDIDEGRGGVHAAGSAAQVSGI